MSEASSLIALYALLARHVWDDENDSETVYIQGHGLTKPQVEAIVREWFEMTDAGLAEGVSVRSWTEVEQTDMFAGQTVYATRVRVTFGN